MKLSDVLPSEPEDLLALEPEDLALPLLRYLAWQEETGGGSLSPYNLSLPHEVQDYPRRSQEEISRAVMAAWGYLEREVLLARKPREKDCYILTRRARSILAGGADRWREFRTAQLLPRDLLHPAIRAEALPDFVRGDYEGAVFKAFKAVEVAVREAAALPSSDIGVSLMRKAFGQDGPLADRDAEPSEREAMAHLFAGAIGLLKNPRSHRYTGAGESAAAIEQLMLASHLLRIVEERGRVARVRT